MVWRDEYSRFVNDGRNVLAATAGGLGACSRCGMRGRETVAQCAWGPIYVSANEPTVLEGDFLCIALIGKYLYCLQARFAGGFVLENEPTGGVLGWFLAPRRPLFGALVALETVAARTPWRVGRWKGALAQGGGV